MSTTSDGLSYEEQNALRYASGYIIRALRKRLKISAHSLKQSLLLHLEELTTTPDSDDESSSSSDRIKLIDRGGLVHVNEMMYMTVFQMELELRPMLEEGLHGIEYDNVIERITERLVNSADACALLLEHCVRILGGGSCKYSAAYDRKSLDYNTKVFSCFWMDRNS